MRKLVPPEERDKLNKRIVRLLTSRQAGDLFLNVKDDDILLIIADENPAPGVNQQSLYAMSETKVREIMPWVNWEEDTPKTRKDGVNKMVYLDEKNDIVHPLSTAWPIPEGEEKPS